MYGDVRLKKEFLLYEEGSILIGISDLIIRTSQKWLDTDLTIKTEPKIHFGQQKYIDMLIRLASLTSINYVFHEGYMLCANAETFHWYNGTFICNALFEWLKKPVIPETINLKNVSYLDLNYTYKSNTGDVEIGVIIECLLDIYYGGGPPNTENNIYYPYELAEMLQQNRSVCNTLYSIYKQTQKAS